MHKVRHVPIAACAAPYAMLQSLLPKNYTVALVFCGRRCAATFTFLVFALASALSAGCSGSYTLARRNSPWLEPISWLGPTTTSEQRSLDRWRAAVGRPIVHVSANSLGLPTNEIAVVSWNTAVGDANVLALVSELRASRGADAPLVLLLQEVYRQGAGVPSPLAGRLSFAGRLGNTGPGKRRTDVESIAAATGLNMYYVPSMRNGSPTSSNEDRGNAILASFPLTDLAAIELPFEHQRRVAVAATIDGLSPTGASWRLRVVSAHLDNLMGPKRLWFAAGEYARARQARALVESVADDTSVLLGGDFNTWFGFSDQAYLETALAFPQTPLSDRRPTFHRLLRLDHIFMRLPTGWRAEIYRGRDDFGSDHLPLIATLYVH